VRSVTTTKRGAAAPTRDVESEELRAEHLVLDTGAGGARVQVQLKEPGAPTRTFVVRFAPSAQLEAVETVEGLPATALGRLELPEIFPAGAGAPPLRPLAPGARWTSSQPVTLPGGGGGRIRTSGRLARLGVVHGRKVATITAQTRLPLVTTSAVNGGQLSIDGVEVSDIDASRVLGDGSVLEASSTTRGSFTISLQPPQGTPGGSIPGTLDVEVTSRTKRLR
jgi:hypothetical protein